MTQRVKHCMGAMVLLVLAFSLSACGLSGSAQTGEVLDETTEKPVEGAIVVAEWIGDVSANWADSKTTCYHVGTAITDDDGEYGIPGWSMKKEDKRDWHKNLTPRDVNITVYKAGYVMADRSFTSGSYEKGVYYLKPFEGSVAERLEYLVGIANSECLSEEYKELTPYSEALYREAQEIAHSTNDKATAERVLFYLNVVQYGWDKAREIKKNH